MKMDWNIPYGEWCLLARDERLRKQAEFGAPRPALAKGVEDVLYIVSNHRKLEMTRFEIVNQYSKMVGARGRKARAEARVEAFSFISGLLQVKLLEWGERRYHVRIAPPERHAEYIKARLETMRNFPKPLIN